MTSFSSIHPKLCKHTIVPSIKSPIWNAIDSLMVICPLINLCTLYAGILISKSKQKGFGLPDLSSSQPIRYLFFYVLALRLCSVLSYRECFTTNDDTQQKELEGFMKTIWMKNSRQLTNVIINIFKKNGKGQAISGEGSWEGWGQKNLSREE